MGPGAQGTFYNLKHWLLRGRGREEKSLSSEREPWKQEQAEQDDMRVSNNTKRWEMVQAAVASNHGLSHPVPGNSAHRYV